ncbi:MAG TPA: hypothetical protein PKA19_12700 [Bacillota bacterium]|nr:hypothetical protein [Bacillota bacterium]
MEVQTILGLPLETWIIVGGLYLLASVFPSVIALILKHREAGK